MPKYDDFDLDLQNKSSKSTNSAESVMKSATYPVNTCYCPTNYYCYSGGCGKATYPVMTCYCE